MKRSKRRQALDCFMSHIDKTDDDHWLWTGSKDRDGYGRFVRRDMAPREYLAHRWSYRYFRGPIPEGLTIDHLCRVRHCCNPDHLEVVSQRVNLLRGDGFVGKQARMTHCKRGHLLSEDNVYRPPSRPLRRHCRQCKALTSSKKSA